MRAVRLNRSDAEYLMMAPAAAGGWVAVHPDCRESVARVCGEERDFLALLPDDWDYGVPVSTEALAEIAEELGYRATRNASVVFEEDVAAEWSRRIRSIAEVL